MNGVLTVLIEEPCRLVGRFAIDQAFRFLSIEPEPLLLHDLQSHAPNPRRLGVEAPFIATFRR